MRIMPGDLMDVFDSLGQLIAVQWYNLKFDTWPPGYFLLRRETYRNFGLQVEWKTFSQETNSGIFLRMPEDIPDELNGNDPYYQRCIEIQIDETSKDFKEDRTTKANSVTAGLKPVLFTELHPQHNGQRRRQAMKEKRGIGIHTGLLQKVTWSQLC